MQNPARPLPTQLVDALLTTDPLQRMRLSQAALAMVLMAIGVLGMHYFVLAGMAPAVPVALWTVVSLGGMALFFVLIRSGRTRGRRDPSLTQPQMMFSLVSGAVAYALTGAGRGAVFPIVMVVLAFGMFQLRPPEVRRVSVFAVAVFGATMALLAWRQPQVYRPAVELGHFIMVATMMPAMGVLAARLARLRTRLREQKRRLAEALGRIQDLATRDELTGLVNQRHVRTLLEQELQRCVRSGHTFCVALIAIDALPALRAAHGPARGEALLAAVAVHMQSVMRVSDVLARWRGDDFVLLLPDSRTPLARGGLERLREHVSQQSLEGLLADRARGERWQTSTTLSAGLAEHRAGESLEQTLDRAQQALAQANAGGPGRVAVA
ncbi:MAG: GGDEF domain-containing protein [Rubrivivax sp.]